MESQLEKFLSGLCPGKEIKEPKDLLGLTMCVKYGYSTIHWMYEKVQKVIVEERSKGGEFYLAILVSPGYYKECIHIPLAGEYYIYTPGIVKFSSKEQTWVLHHNSYSAMDIDVRVTFTLD